MESKENKKVEAMKEIQEVVWLRLQSIIEASEKECQKKITQKRGEFAAKGNWTWGGSIGVFKDIEVTAVKEIAAIMVKFYQDTLFDIGKRLEDEKDVDFIIVDLENLLNRLTASTIAHIEQWCDGAGFGDAKVRWREIAEKDFSEIKTQFIRSLRADQITAKLRAIQTSNQPLLIKTIIENQLPLIDPKDIAIVKSERLRELLIELNKNVKEQCPHGSSSLMRAVLANSIRQYFIDQGKKSELKRNMTEILDQFVALPELPITVREAAKYLKGSVKILGDAALHSDEIVLRMTDISNIAATFKIVIQWIAQQKPPLMTSFIPITEVLSKA